MSIFLTEKANEIVTDRGNPSGIATATTVIARIRYFSRSIKSDASNPLRLFSIVKRITSTTKIRIAEYNPKKPISLAIASSFCYNGVAARS